MIGRDQPEALVFWKRSVGGIFSDRCALSLISPTARLVQNWSDMEHCGGTPSTTNYASTRPKNATAYSVLRTPRYAVGVLDIGHGVTTVFPSTMTAYRNQAVRRLDFGGVDITRYVSAALQDKHDVNLSIAQTVKQYGEYELPHVSQPSRPCISMPCI